jgi:ABC-type transport system involved in multi-copper enzyme maturation permease subunit
VFLAMLRDAYRELNSKRLFWVILALSLVFVLVYGSIGFDNTGVSMFFGLMHIDNELLTHDSRLSNLLYRGIFATFVVPLWLAWIATILALISTATIFPDFVSGGSIDLVLAKPVGRIRLFTYKFITSLLFVFLQIAVFCTGIFLCMGLRLSDWDWRIFIAIPVVLLFYSYLFSVCVLIGTWTRSALAALLLTLLFWFGLYAVNQTEGLLNVVRTRMTIEAEDLEAESENLRREGSGESRIEMVDEEREKIQETIDRLDRWHKPTRSLQAFVPKTSETIALLDRYLVREDDVNLMDLLAGNVQQTESGGFEPIETNRDRRVMQRIEEEYEGRSLGYVIGTSLMFEIVVLSAACFIFVRRDY